MKDIQIMNAITRYASHNMATESCANQIRILTSMHKKNTTTGLLCLFPVVYVTATYERKHGIHPYQLQPQPSGYLRTKIMETVSAQTYTFCMPKAFDVSLCIAYVYTSLDWRTYGRRDASCCVRTSILSGQRVQDRSWHLCPHCFAPIGQLAIAGS